MTGPSHATLDAIAAYHAGTLPPEEEARLQDHLVECAECTALLLEREELARLAAEPEEVPAAAGWESMRARLPGLEPRAADPPPPLPFARPARRAPAPRLWQAALAASLLATAGLAFWSASLYRTVGELSRPEANAPIRDLSPAPRRGAGDAAVLALKPGTRFLTLVLGAPGDEAFPDWEAEISRGDESVWRGRGLRPNEFRSFSLTLPRRLLPDGEYRIVLRGLQGRRGLDAGGAQGGALVGEYRLRITTEE